MNPSKYPKSKYITSERVFLFSESAKLSQKPTVTLEVLREDKLMSVQQYLSRVVMIKLKSYKLKAILLER